MASPDIAHGYAALEKGAKLVPHDFELAELKAHDVELKVLNCGLCHTDLSIVNNEWGLTKFPCIAGHEIVGEVVAVGPEVKHLTLGQVVGVGACLTMCMDCHECMRGKHNMCAKYSGPIRGMNGGFADRVRALANACVPLPAGLDVESAGPLFCAGITVFSPLLEFNVRPIDRVAVIGIGGLGHLALQFYRAWGCHVTAFSSSKDVEELKKLGAHEIINSRDPEAIKAAAKSFDFVISTVSVELDWASYINTLKPNGRLHFVGVVSKPIMISIFSLLTQQRSVSSSPIGPPTQVTQMLEFAARHDIRPLIEVYPFDQINEAFLRLTNEKPKYRVVLKN
eukprot:TRINITY_DN17002_c0_g1_i1.p1 TRINITY_DN17002_c0_g1~~TRINITY_DN17002_c0_g1_i1.p1  ORF type:complete len:338 (-),score=52.42 TRINITY_DN17002_c0_g1_i1:104-1117(-)